MNFVDKLGEGICASIDMIIDKNRQLAQLNRLSTIIRTETEIINNAYIALGKQYRHVLEGCEAAEDMSRVVEVLAYSEKRLKKAQARYDYIKVYGVPVPHTVAEANATAAAETDDEYVLADAAAEEAEAAATAEDDSDITIACADDSKDADDCADCDDKDDKTEEDKAE